MDKIRKSLSAKWLVFLVIAFGFASRFFVSLRGHNFDFDSFLIVVDCVDRGLNVYACTHRYNYGPVWFNVLQLLYLTAFKNPEVFRYFLIATLSLVDLGIFAIIWKKCNKAAAFIFFLNPISIIITGYHNQFDNFALLICILSVLLIGDNLTVPFTRRKILGLIVLGISLVTKHIFFAFPVWLAVKQKGFFQKILILIVPVSIFLLSFIPYWNEGKTGIITNVFLYDSFNNEIFYKLFIPSSINALLPTRLIWIALIAFFAVYLRKKNVFMSLLYYTCILVVTSPAIANQYLAIVVAFIAVEFNLIFLLYTIVGTLYLLTNSDGLHFLELWPFGYILRDYFYMLLIFLLSIGLIWRLWRKRLLDTSKWVLAKLRIQLRYPS